jgi:hypothetical protein
MKPTHYKQCKDETGTRPAHATAVTDFGRELFEETV